MAYISCKENECNSFGSGIQYKESNQLNMFDRDCCEGEDVVVIVIRNTRGGRGASRLPRRVENPRAVKYSVVFVVICSIFTNNCLKNSRATLISVQMCLEILLLEYYGSHKMQSWGIQSLYLTTHISACASSSFSSSSSDLPSPCSRQPLGRAISSNVLAQKHPCRADTAPS